MSRCFTTYTVTKLRGKPQEVAPTEWKIYPELFATFAFLRKCLLTLVAAQVALGSLSPIELD